MSYIVSQESRERTYCPNDFQCLAEDGDDICQVYDLGRRRIVITHCSKRRAYCDYYKPFNGPEGICVCPTHVELYARYGI